MDLDAGPLRTLVKEAAPGDSVHVRVLVESVSVFHLSACLEECKPDLVVSLGSWPNVLTDEICARHTTADFFPSGKDRREVQKRQQKVFDDPMDFLVAFTASVIAQTPASFLVLGPKHYLWRTSANTLRPVQKFQVLCLYGDYYQGKQEMSENFIGIYYPGSPSRAMPYLDDGSCDMLELV